MKQMVNTTAPAQVRMRFCGLGSGCFFRSRNGRVFFSAQHGKFLIWFPVLEDGTVRQRGGMDGGIGFLEQVEVVKGEDVGAKFKDGKIVWSKDEAAFVS